jgi:CDP-diacylglycerol---glycerol-3-phosphate 3-phosphatidyltransferase
MNLANKLTLARIFLIPIFLIALAVKEVKYSEYIAAGLFVLAASTDGLDGYIARSRNQVTRLGKFMDPLADKLLVSAALISLVELQRLSAWVAVIIIGREFAITGLRSIAAAEGHVIEASKLGKYKTVSQIIAIIVMFITDFPYYAYISKVAMGIAVIFTIYSGFDYFSRAKHLLKAGAK